MKILIPALIFVAACSHGSTAESRHQDDLRYRPIVSTFVISKLQEIYPKNAPFWAGWGLLELKNGEPMAVDSYAMSDQELDPNEIGDHVSVGAVAWITFKQGNKTQKISCRLGLEIREKVSLADTKNSYSREENPNCEDSQYILRKDPIADFRKYPKKVRQGINDRMAYIGMPEEALEPALGGLHVNESNYAGRITRQYVLGDSEYIYVENGKVTSIQRF